jgi:hypothetical protein
MAPAITKLVPHAVKSHILQNRLIGHGTCQTVHQRSQNGLPLGFSKKNKPARGYHVRSTRNSVFTLSPLLPCPAGKLGCSMLTRWSRRISRVPVFGSELTQWKCSHMKRTMQTYPARFETEFVSLSCCHLVPFPVIFYHFQSWMQTYILPDSKLIQKLSRMQAHILPDSK